MYKKVLTADGSSSLYNEEIEEGYHSSSGAITESLEKFAKPLRPFVSKKKIKVLDTCFGLGYRSCALAYVFSDRTVDITAVEIDPSLFKAMQEVSIPKELQSTYSIFQRLSEKENEVTSKQISCKVITGDARVIVPTFTESFDIIVHDPFSPKKVPQLWSEEFLSLLVSKLKVSGVLVTYSSSGVVRDILRKNGCKIINGPSVGRRAPATLAVRRGVEK